MINWHSLFSRSLYSDLDLLNGFTFESEKKLYTSDASIDMLVARKDNETADKNDIRKFFKGLNVIEFKSRHQNLNLKVWHKVHGYTEIYLSQLDSLDRRQDHDMTLSFFTDHMPEKMFRQLKEDGFSIQLINRGIYHLERKYHFPVQVVVLSELDGNHYPFLKALSKNATDEDMLRLLGSPTESRDLAGALLRNYEQKTEGKFMENLEKKDIKELVAEVRELMSYDWDGMEQKVIQANRIVEKANRNAEREKKNAERANRNAEKSAMQAEREKKRADAAEAENKSLRAEIARLKANAEKAFSYSSFGMNSSVQEVDNAQFYAVKQTSGKHRYNKKRLLN